MKHNSQIKTTFSIRGISLIGMLSAIAAVLTLFDFPLIFIAPPFYKFDFSEVPVLLGTFAMGPIAGALIELIKVLLNLLFNGTVTGYVGELSNLLMGLIYILPAGIIYNRFHTKKGAYLGLMTGSFSLAIFSCIINAFVLIPAYTVAFGISLDSILDMAHVSSFLLFIIVCVLPFNLIKGIISSVITALLYKKVSYVIKGFRDNKL